MDLVKIGFMIQADGLKDAETRVDNLLKKVDELGKKKVNIPSGGSGSGSSPSSSAGTGGNNLKTSERMIKQQQLLASLLPTLDRQTAALVARFQLASDSVAELNKFMTLLGNNQAIVKQQQEAAKLVKEQQKLAEEAEQARQKKYSAEQKYYQKQQELARKAAESDLAAIKKAEEEAEKARQRKFSAEQAYYQKQMELARKAAEAEAKARKKADEDAEASRQKRFAAEQKYYQQQQEQARQLAQAERNRLAGYQKQIDITSKTAQYQSQGLTSTNAGKLARMEISGADTQTVERYKTALLAAQQAKTSFANATEDATKKVGFWNTQIGGIIKYAVLSAAIYGVMSAMLNLGAAIIKTADEYTAIQNRMRLYITDANELARVNEKLAQYAVANNVGLRETSTLFARLAPSMQKIGANTAAVTTVVDAFGKSMRIGGATAMEAASATLQFSQAMASGKLNGDEFRAISEASPRFLKAIADGSGIAAEKLKAMSSAGALTTEVISKALIKEYARLSAENEKLGYTLEQGSNALKTAFTVMIGEFNEGAGITQFFGTQMMKLSANLLDATEGAKEFGASVKTWFTDNKAIFEAMGTAVEVLAALFAGRLVTSILASVVAAGKATQTNVALIASQRGVSTSSALATVAMQRLGVAALTAGQSIATAGGLMKTAFTFLGGWVGIVTTVVAATAAYLAFNNANAATAEAFRKEGESLDEAIGKYKELSRVKQLSMKDSQQAYIADLTKEYNTSNAALVRYLNSLGTHKSLTGESSGAMAELAKQYQKGEKTIAQVVDAISKQSDLSESAKAKVRELAATVEDSSSAAKQAKQEYDAMTKAVQGTGDKAAFAKTGVDAFTKGLEEQVKKLRETTMLAKQYGLEIQSAAKLQAELANRFSAREASNKERLEKLLGLKTKYAAKGDTTTLAVIDKGLLANQKAQNLLLQQKAQLTEQIAKGLKTVEQAEAEQAAYTKSLRQAEKDSDKSENTKKKNREKYENQASELSAYITLLTEAQSLEVARIASEKEYQNAFGTSLEMAKGIVELENAKARATAQTDLRQQMLDAAEIATFQELGVDLETARLAVQNKYIANEAGMKYVGNLRKQQLNEMTISLDDQVRFQRDLNNYVQQGYSIELAKAQLAIDRVGDTSKEGKAIAQTVKNMQKQLEIEQERQQYLSDFNRLGTEELKLKAAITAGISDQTLRVAALRAQYQNVGVEQANQKLALEDIVASGKEQVANTLEWNKAFSDVDATLASVKAAYPFLKDEQREVIANERKLVEMAKEFAKTKEAKKDKPLGDFSAVDFDAFGDFGDPFKDALEGANNFLVVLQDTAKEMKLLSDEKARLNEKLAQTEEGTVAYKNLQTEVSRLGELEADVTAQSKAARTAFIDKSISGVKAMFKEESKGYKVLTILEQAYQAKKIAFALWEKRDRISQLALDLLSQAKSVATFIAGTTAKIGAQMGLNVAQAQGAVAAAGNAPPPIGFAAAAAMLALLAGIGIAVSGGGSSGSFAATNDGTGTVFGDSSAKSESILKAMEILADNSDLGLPISAALLRSVQNIENSIGGVANLYIRGGAGGQLASSVNAGFTKDFVGKTVDVAYKAINTMTFGLADTLTLGLFSSVGKFISKAFGTTTKVKGQGLAGFSQTMADIMSDGFELKEYVDVEKKKKSFGITTSKKRKTYYSDASAELENQFTLVFSNIRDSILQAAPLLKDDTDQVVKALDDYVVNIGRVSTKGLSGEELQEALINIFSAEADKMAQEVLSGLDGFQQIGEGYYETAIRVAAGVEQAKYFTDRLNITTIAYSDVIYKQGDVAAEMLRQSILVAEGTKYVENGFYDLVESVDGSAEEIYDFVKQLRELQDAVFATGKNGDYLTSVMMLGAGGLDALADGLDAYFEMLSPAEQAAELTRRLANEFDLIGQVLPADVKAFRDLVASIDITSEAGQKLYGQVIALAPEFNDLQDALENANDSVNALVKSLRDLAAEAMGNIQAQDQAQNLDYLRYAFEQDAMKAMLGDTAAAERLLTTGKDLMTLSKQYSVDGSAYARDLAMIQQAATVAADKQEAGLGYTTPSLSTPAVNTDATVVQTSNAATDAKLETLREDMIAAMIAIAKSTQDTAQRLERWDYGDRMVVRVEQDAGETIPVKVTP